MAGSARTQSVGAVVLLWCCACLLIAPETAAEPQAWLASCDRYTDSSTKVVCERIETKVSRNSAAAAIPQPDAAVQGRVDPATHTGPGDPNCQQQAKPEFDELLQGLASGSLAQHGGFEAVAEVLARAGHHYVWHPRHKETHEPKRQDKFHKPSYQNPTEDYSEHFYKQSQEDPYGGNHGLNPPNPPPAHGSYPPCPIPLYPTAFTGDSTFSASAAGKASPTGGLAQGKGEDLTSWGCSIGLAQWPNPAHEQQQQQQQHEGQDSPAVDATVSHFTDRNAAILPEWDSRHKNTSMAPSNSNSTHEQRSPVRSQPSLTLRSPANTPHPKADVRCQSISAPLKGPKTAQTSHLPPLPKAACVHANAFALQAQAERSKAPVDLVYLWVNGSDPALQQELQQLQPRSKTHPGLEDPARHSRFDAGRDELRYSIRSVEMYLPWINHIYIVTNGQVPDWLDITNPRITVVPHGSIFRNASHLPTFNSAAIQTNLANIPGLSEAFILMDDDWFLTAPWEMSDFVAPDGGQVLTGSSPADEDGPGESMYLNKIHNLNKTFTQRFGPWPRFEPSHSPHYMQLHWLNKLRQELPELFTTTSAHHFRAPNDLQIAAAYEWFVSQHQPGTHPTPPDGHASFLAMDDPTAWTFVEAAIQDLGARKRLNDSTAAALIASAEYQTGGAAKRAQLAVQAAVKQSGSASGKGSSVTFWIRSLKKKLSEGWMKPKAKAVCLQDEVDDDFVAARQLIDPVVQAFLASRYPNVSQFELPAGTSNGCRRRLPMTQFGRLPTAPEFEVACGVGGHKPRWKGNCPVALPTITNPRLTLA